MPTPKQGETRESFRKRCIPYVIKEGNAKDGGHAWQICNGIYDQWKKKQHGVKNEMTKERILLHLNSQLRPYYELDASSNELNNVELDRSTIIVGDRTYNGVYFPKEELEKAFMSWDKQPINLDHSEKVEDQVGYVIEPQYLDGRVTIKPYLDNSLPKYPIADGFIKSRIRAGVVPNVSVGVWVDREYEEMEDGETRVTGRNLDGYHLAMVVHGACSPQDGCGIGLNKEKPIPIEAEEKPTVTITTYNPEQHGFYIPQPASGGISGGIVTIVDDKKTKEEDLIRLKKELLKELILKEELKNNE